MNIKCFWIEPTPLTAVWLRRYVGSDKCVCTGSMKYHNAMNRIEDAPVIRDEKGRHTSQPAKPHEDERWPKQCECGYVFQPSDEWQMFDDVIYSNGIPLREQLPGAMFDAGWLHDSYRGPDGRCLSVILPGNHIWQVDGPSKKADGTDGNGWQRSGEVPNVSATPSIVVPGWHGHLVNGELIPVAGG